MPEEIPTCPIMLRAVRELLAEYDARNYSHVAGLIILLNIQTYLVAYPVYTGEYQHHSHSNWLMDDLEAIELDV